MFTVTSWHSDSVGCNSPRATRRLGIHVGHDLSVIGFDSIPQGRILDPELITVDIGPAQIGQLSAELAIRGNAAESSRPAIQQFVDSLTLEGATKGVFGTASEFTREARDFLARVTQRIVLSDGSTLAKLMICHEVGVRARQTYVLRTVHEDYFCYVS